MNPEDHIEETIRGLLQSARDAGMTITGDGRIGEGDLSELLGYARDYLKDQRAAGKCVPPRFALPCGGSRSSVLLREAAQWIWAAREN